MQEEYLKQEKIALLFHLLEKILDTDVSMLRKLESFGYAHQKVLFSRSTDRESFLFPYQRDLTLSFKFY